MRHPALLGFVFSGSVFACGLAACSSDPGADGTDGGPPDVVIVGHDGGSHPDASLPDGAPFVSPDAAGWDSTVPDAADTDAAADAGVDAPDAARADAADAALVDAADASDAETPDAADAGVVDSSDAGDTDATDAASPDAPDGDSADAGADAPDEASADASPEDAGSDALASVCAGYDAGTNPIAAVVATSGATVIGDHGTVPANTPVVITAGTGPAGVVADISIGFCTGPSCASAASVPMASGADAGAASEGWAGSIPGQPAGTSVAWWVLAHDACTGQPHYWSNFGNNFHYTTQ